MEEDNLAQQLLRNATAKVSDAMQKAVMELAQMKKATLTVEFLLLGLMDQSDSIVLKVFDELGLVTGEVRTKISDMVFETSKLIPEAKMQNNCLLYTSPSPRDRG